ncbi:SMI1/KNR4 family protein [Rudanella lutea]|uniref:SMI1/KNR4 family protein n=1 Tax=Rudanella lutea TaxID=451374 RepID=UPI0003808A7F|nr:SMI1/KNR4 family protein [Rudanella lutea]
MKTLTLKSSCLSITNKEILETEATLGIILPEDYKAFLLLSNGGYPLESEFKKEDDWSFGVQLFYGICSVTDQSIVFYASMFHQKFMSKHFIPFAHDPGGWMFVISTRDQDYGHVYFYRPDEPEDDCLTHLTNSFEEFIDKLQVPIY